MADAGQAGANDEDTGSVAGGNTNINNGQTPLSGLSTAAKAGIGVIIAAAIVALIAALMVYARKKKNEEEL